jgi:hypothetical protein
MTLDLTKSEARFLAAQLGNHIHRVRTEFVHTDDRHLKHAIAQDLELLEKLRLRLTYGIARSPSEAVQGQRS